MARVCGAGSGSSPLARGLPLPATDVVFPEGIIPARAGFTWVVPASDTCQPDHPRSRGVYVRVCCVARACVGSSPLARGLPESGTQARRRTRDHPRSRGVYVCITCVCVAVGGSSPLARGLRADDVQGHACLRIIPARAGFTASRWDWRSGWRDHPRSRGVYREELNTPTYMAGSSPLARGLPPKRSARRG